ncbi:MAG TPA: NfeD family protein [Anaerolineales bacterium]|nr:NfeD family protein [Anaerolineales bacterium]
MDFLLEPNIAYLFLLGGVLMAMLALATPGTGFLEIGAFFCIVLAGYAVYNLSYNWWALLLIVLSIVPFIYAIQKPKRELFLGVSILLLIIGSVFMFPRGAEHAGVNPAVATVASGLTAGFLWIAIRKSMEAAYARPRHDLDGLVGQVGEARTVVHDEGSVQVGGELWSARSESSIPAGSSIRVVRRDGFIVVVEKVNHTN